MAALSPLLLFADEGELRAALKRAGVGGLAMRELPPGLQAPEDSPAEVAERLALLLQSVEQARDAILIFDRGADPVVRYANPAFCRLTGLPVHEVIGRHLRTLPGWDRSPDAPRGLDTALRHGTTLETRICGHHADGTPFVAELQLNPLRDTRGHTHHFLALNRDVTEDHARRARLEHQALHDPLTGLPNRLLLQERLRSALREASRHQRSLGVLFVDLDRFKVVNDTLGHRIGDLVLQAVAERLRHQVRARDTVARLGGDEFVVILQDLKHTDDAVRCARKLIDALAAPILVESQEVRISPSIGIALHPEHGEGPDALLDHADQAMYRAKDAGRGTWRIWAPHGYAPGEDAVSVRGQVAGALERGELSLWWQPVIDVESRSILGAEALLRWDHPSRATLLPDRFLPLLHEVPNPQRVTRWIFQEACARAAELRALQPHFRATVNVTGPQLFWPGLVGAIEQALADAELPARNLQVDVPEDLLLASPTIARNRLQALRRLGVRTVADDFGTGHTSLHHLRLLPLDGLKIDVSCIAQIRDTCEPIVVAIAAVAEALGLDLEAEGVTTTTQAQILAELGCVRQQGFHFGPPMPAGELGDRLRREVVRYHRAFKRTRSGRQSTSRKP